MCGICGIVHSDPTARVEPESIARMNAALAHRGPDDAGQWHGGHAALAMRRLSVIDLSTGDQPMVNEDGSIIVVFNGEIYNFQELRMDLERQGHVFKTHSDTEVIAHAYEQYGDNALQRFNGMFAFALYDRCRERLLLARDRLGIKPLFYAHHQGILFFASELDALLRSGAPTGGLDAAALDAYFTYLYIPAPDTAFRNLRKLLPGEKIIFERGNLTKERYWQVQSKPDPAWTLDSAADRYMELLTDAVRLRRVSDVPLGALLSGGLDSSAVVGILSMMASQRVKTFTIGFDDPEADELAYARAAAEQFGTDHTEATLRPDLVEVAGRLVRHFGEPFADSSAIPTWLVAKVARRDVTVALSGDGGDELFAGYTWTHMNRKVACYRRLPAALRHLVNTAVHLTPRCPFTAKLRRFSKDSFLSPMESFRRRQTCFLPGERAVLYSSELAEAIRATAVDRFPETAESAGALSLDDQMLHHDLNTYLPDDILTKVDRMSMANSLEARVPLLDHRLVEFAATVPFDLKYRRGISKRLVKHAVNDLLPPQLLKQRKRGFAVPIHRWLRGELQRHFEEMALGPDTRSRAYLRPEMVRLLLDAHAAGTDDYGHHLWAVLMFEHWLRYVESIPGTSLA